MQEKKSTTMMSTTEWADSEENNLPLTGGDKLTQDECLLGNCRMDLSIN